MLRVSRLLAELGHTDVISALEELKLRRAEVIRKEADNKE